MTARELAARAAEDALAMVGPANGTPVFTMRTVYPDTVDETRRSLAAVALDILQDRRERLSARELADAVLPTVKSYVLSGRV